MSQSRDYLWQIALTLQRYEVIPEVMDVLIQKACEDLQKLRAHERKPGDLPVDEVFNVFFTFISIDSYRFGGYDAECIYENEDYAQLLELFAATTGGEWSPECVTSAHHYTSWDNGHDEIDFDFRGEHFHWEFNDHCSDWVGIEFLELLEQFCEEHLTGGFFDIPTRDQTAVFVYLPHQAISGISAIMEQIEERFSDFDAFVEPLPA